MPFVREQGDHADVADMDTNGHGRKWMRLRSEACKALQAVCPEMQTFSNAASTFHVAADRMRFFGGWSRAEILFSGTEIWTCD